MGLCETFSMMIVDKRLLLRLEMIFFTPSWAILPVIKEITFQAAHKDFSRDVRCIWKSCCIILKFWNAGVRQRGRTDGVAPVDQPSRRRGH